MNSYRHVVLAALAVAGLLSCAQQSRTARAQLSAPAPGPVKVGRFGLACRGEGIGPVGYRVNDIGKWGVPNPSRDQSELLSRIRRYDRSPTLRFAFIGQGPYEPRFIVYDNRDKPCDETPVLNGTPIEYYQPQQTPYVFSGPEGGTPYPWGTPRP